MESVASCAHTADPTLTLRFCSDDRCWGSYLGMGMGMLLVLASFTLPVIRTLHISAQHYIYSFPYRKEAPSRWLAHTSRWEWVLRVSWTYIPSPWVHKGQLHSGWRVSLSLPSPIDGCSGIICRHIYLLSGGDPVLYLWWSSRSSCSCSFMIPEDQSESLFLWGEPLKSSLW